MNKPSAHANISRTQQYIEAKLPLLAGTIGVIVATQLGCAHQKPAEPQTVPTSVTPEPAGAVVHTEAVERLEPEAALNARVDGYFGLMGGPLTEIIRNSGTNLEGNPEEFKLMLKEKAKAMLAKGGKFILTSDELVEICVIMLQKDFHIIVPAEKQDELKADFDKSRDRVLIFDLLDKILEKNGNSLINFMHAFDAIKKEINIEINNIKRLHPVQAGKPPYVLTDEDLDLAASRVFKWLTKKKS